MTSENKAASYDVIVIGAGLGGLVCAAMLARAGRRVLVVEQHVFAGGYATTFVRKGERIEVSLHAIGDMLPGGTLPRILADCGITTDTLRFVSSPVWYRAEFPGYAIDVPACDVDGYARRIANDFGCSEDSLQALFARFDAIRTEVLAMTTHRIQGAGGSSHAAGPTIMSDQGRTLAQVVNGFVDVPEAVSVVCALWGYYGLPPSRLASINFAYPWTEYHRFGAHYPVSRSQDLSDALVAQIVAAGGEIRLHQRIERILTTADGACGVALAGGEQIRCSQVVANANPTSVFKDLLPDYPLPARYARALSRAEPTLGCVQLFAILNVEADALFSDKAHEVFINESFDHDEGYAAVVNHCVERAPFAVTIYNKISTEYSGAGKTLISAFQLSDFQNWHFASRSLYRREKERVTAILRERLERRFPGINACITFAELSTPLTNHRYTSNPRGAIYGSVPSVDNSMLRRLSHRTPVRNLFLTGAWTRPGGGYSGTIWSGYLAAHELLRTAPPDLARVEQ